MNTPINWTIGRRIGVGFTALIAILAVVGVICYERVVSIGASSGELELRAMPGLVLLGQIESQVKENYLYTTQHIMATDAATKAAIDKDLSEKSNLNTALYKDYEALIDEPDERAAYEQLTVRRNAYRDMRAKVLTLSRSKQVAQVLQADQALNTELYPIYKDYVATLRSTRQRHAGFE